MKPRMHLPRARRYLGVVVCAVLAASTLMSSSPAMAAALSARLHVVVENNGGYHRTFYDVVAQGGGGAVTTYSWDAQVECGAFIPSTGSGGEGSRATWFHGADRGCPEHSDWEYPETNRCCLQPVDHASTVTVTVTSGRESVFCTHQGNSNAEIECTPGEPDEGEARIESSTFPLTNRIEKAKKQLKPLIDPIVAEYNSVAEELVMQQRALDQEAELHAFRIAHVRTIEAQISELRQDIADGIGREESAEMERLQGSLRNAQLEEFAVRLRLRNKERVVEELAIRREGLAAQLLIHSQPLQAIDFELTGMVVAAGSKKVYEVDVVSPYSRLFELTRKIREQRGIVEDLLAAKKEAFKEFQATHQAGSRRLAEIAELIWENAKKAAVIDFASNACDVLIAGSKGGWAGVITEVTSKVYEAAFKEMIADPIGDPNPGKQAVEAWFRETVTGAVGSNALAIGFERSAKETGVKLVKDFFVDALGDEYPGLKPIDAQGMGPTATADALRRARGFRDRLKDLIPKMKDQTFHKGFGEWVKGSVGRKLIQDATKNFFKRQLKNAEMAAWMEYIQLEVHAQGWFGIWQAAANSYWEADDALQGWMLEKDRIMEEFDRDTAVGAPSVQKSFSLPATLRIRLLVPRPKSFGEIPIQVWVSGVQARRTSATVFEVSTKQLSGTEFTIEVR